MLAEAACWGRDTLLSHRIGGKCSREDPVQSPPVRRAPSATREPRERFREKPAVLHLIAACQLYRERNRPSEAAVVERPAELKHSPFSRFSKEPQIMSSQALKATVQQSVRMASQVSILQIPLLLLKYKIKCKNYNDSNLGSRAAKSTRRRICLESRGEISFSIFFYLLSNISFSLPAV